MDDLRKVVLSKPAIAGVSKRVRAKRHDALMLTQMTAPKALKQTVKSQLQEVRGE